MAPWDEHLLFLHFDDITEGERAAIVWPVLAHQRAPMRHGFYIRETFGSRQLRLACRSAALWQGRPDYVLVCESGGQSV